MTDVPGEAGFNVGSAYVSVSPDAESFPEQLEEQIGGLNYVVQVPVVPDTGDFAAVLDEREHAAQLELKARAALVPQKAPRFLR